MLSSEKALGDATIERDDKNMAWSDSKTDPAVSRKLGLREGKGFNESTADIVKLSSHSSAVLNVV